jgi:hypothetical protein
MTISKSETTPLMIPVRTAPMPFTMAIRQAPIVRKMDPI